jgi:S-DNA-T family DNA segregation ATPase FtsK/SpoIIIE
MDRCDACPFVYADVPAEAVAGRLRGLVPAYRSRLAGPDVAGPELLRAHPRPGVWSALEYACHVRDVLGAQRGRLLRAQAEDRPEAVSMDRDGRVARERYNEQDPAAVADELAAAAELLAGAFDALGGSGAPGWQRVIVYHWPETAERDMAWLGRHTVHEGVHHLRDIDDVLAAAATAAAAATTARPPGGDPTGD